MAASQQHIEDRTPMGANLVTGGCTFRIWAPRAKAVHVCGSFNNWAVDEASRLAPGPTAGHFAGYFAGVGDGAEYKFWIDGESGPGWKRDPFARELALEPKYPHSNCVVRDPAAYSWHDDYYYPPRFNDLVIYQLHVGAFARRGHKSQGRFLDVAQKVPYLSDLGVNAVELLPVVEFPSDNSLGYNNVDFFSPEMGYCVGDDAFGEYVTQLNTLLAARGKRAINSAQISTQIGQLKALIDVCHAYGIAVFFDVVYNHAGDFNGGPTESESLYFLDRYFPNDENNSLYFTDHNWVGKVFAFYDDAKTAGVRQFLIDNAVFWLTEAHVDGLRYDEVKVIDDNGGWNFLKAMTGTVRWVKARAPQIAEFWRGDPTWAVKPAAEGGAGFDMAWADGLRNAVRQTISECTGGRDATINLDQVRDQLYPPFGPDSAWRMVNHLENHDLEWSG